jgi:hypothetical protein
MDKNCSVRGTIFSRLIDLEQERQLSPLPPVVVGGALIIPAGLLQKLQGQQQAEPGQFAKETKRVEQLAMAAVMAQERSLGYEPQDVSVQKAVTTLTLVLPLVILKP